MNEFPIHQPLSWLFSFSFASHRVRFKMETVSTEFVGSSSQLLHLSLFIFLIIIIIFFVLLHGLHILLLSLVCRRCVTIRQIFFDPYEIQRGTFFYFVFCIIAAFLILRFKLHSYCIGENGLEIYQVSIILVSLFFTNYYH